MAKTIDGRSKKRRFVGVPYHVFSSQQYIGLSNPAVRLLWELAGQLNGSNNGTLSACGALMTKRGIPEGSRFRAYKELLQKGFIVITRQGWKQRGKPTLVALTWNGIDESPKIEYDEGVNPSPVPLGYWCKKIPSEK